MATEVGIKNWVNMLIRNKEKKMVNGNGACVSFLGLPQKYHRLIQC